MTKSAATAFPSMITDAHHHLWDLDAIHYPWLAAKGVRRFFGDPTPIQKNYLPVDFKQDIGSLPVQNSVHIQVGAAHDQHLAETAWLQQLVDRGNVPSAIVAYCELEADDSNTMLDQLQQYQAVRGVRQIVGRSPDEDKVTGSGALLDNRQWLLGLKALANRGLRFDLQLIPDQMQQVATVLANVEDLPVALCHCGSPWYRDRQGWAMWKNGLQRLAELPNVYCKISGLGMFDHHWTEESLKPIINTVIDIFGPDRCMFGSNFPVDKLHRDYQSLWESYSLITSDLSSIQRDGLFNTNCRRFYNL